MINFGETLASVATFAIVFVAIFLLRRNGKKNGEGKRRYPPCLPTLPFIGSYPIYRVGIEQLPEFFMKTAESLGPVIRFYLGRKLVVVLNGRNAIFDAFQKHSEAFADRDYSWTETTSFNAKQNGIIFSHYHDAFKRTHKTTLSILKEFGFGEIKETEHRICEELEIMLKEINERNGQPFFPKYTFAMVSGYIMVKILFGRQTMSLINSRQLVETANEFVTNIEPKIDVAPIIRFLPKYRKMLSNSISSHAKVIEILQEAIKLSRSDDSEPNFVKRYLEITGSNCDHDNLLFIVRDLMLGSSDTVSTTIQWAITQLANQIHVQDRLQKEIDELIPDSRLPSLDDKPHLPYAEVVIIESMRHRTQAPFAVPHATTKDTEACGYFIPSGCVVFPNIFSVHMDPKVWTDPENFRPERFLDKENKVVGRDKVIPFSVGKRSCIGEVLARQQIFLILTSLVQQFDIRPPEGLTSIPVKENRRGGIVPFPFQVRLIPRRKA